MPETFDFKLAIPQNSPVLFYSRFECGNLMKAVKIPVKPELSFSGLEKVIEDPVMHEYDLYMRPDSSTENLTNSFLFKVITQDLKRGTKIRLNIRNFVRNKSLFEKGMIPRIKYEDSQYYDPEKRDWHVDPLVTKDVKYYLTQ